MRHATFINVYVLNQSAVKYTQYAPREKQFFVFCAGMPFNTDFIQNV